MGNTYDKGATQLRLMVDGIGFPNRVLERHQYDQQHVRMENVNKTRIIAQLLKWDKPESTVMLWRSDKGAIMFLQLFVNMRTRGVHRPGSTTMSRVGMSLKLRKCSGKWLVNVGSDNATSQYYCKARPLGHFKEEVCRYWSHPLDDNKLGEFSLTLTTTAYTVGFVRPRNKQEPRHDAQSHSPDHSYYCKPMVGMVQSPEVL